MRHLNCFKFLFAIVSIVQFCPAQVDVIYNDLVWSDEFETNGAVNPDKWFHQTQIIIPGVGWANDEEQHYTDRNANSYAFSGFLNIVAKRESFNDQGLTKQFTSARLNSKFAFTYGRVDVRAKLPIEDGTWPAIWLLGKNIFEPGAYWHNTFGEVGWPDCGEIDIMEHGIFPTEDINFINSALHTPCCNGGNPNQGGAIVSDLENDYHVYSMNWSPDQITFLVDGVGYYTYNPSTKNASTWPFFEDQYILLNIAMGGLAGTVDPSINISGVTMSIDYVRVYQNNELSTSEFDASKFRIFPNPTSESIKVISNEIIDKLELYSILGNLIRSKSKSTNTMDVSSLNSGIYLLNIYSGSKKITKKIVINNLYTQ